MNFVNCHEFQVLDYNVNLQFEQEVVQKNTIANKRKDKIYTISIEVVFPNIIGNIDYVILNTVKKSSENNGILKYKKIFFFFILFLN